MTSQSFEHHQEQGQDLSSQDPAILHRHPGRDHLRFHPGRPAAKLVGQLPEQCQGFPLGVAGGSSTPVSVLHPEYSLSARIHDHRLTAKYDLIAALPGKQFWIYDWKTSLTIPPREKLEQRIQTRLYSWMLVNAGAHLNGGSPISPDQVLMTYWFAQNPGRQMLFPYSQEQYETDDA